jgi:thioesterase domain-containing protein
MVPIYLFHHSIGLFAVFLNLVVVLTPKLAAAASPSSSQSYLNQQALNDILGRAAPIAGKGFSLHYIELI